MVRADPGIWRNRRNREWVRTRAPCVATKSFSRGSSRRRCFPISTFLRWGGVTQRIVEFAWNPLSIREASALQGALRSLAGLFTTVTDALRSIYGCVTRRIHGAIENGLYCEPRLVSRHTNDVQIDAQEVVELYLARSVRVGVVETWKLDIGGD